MVKGNRAVNPGYLAMAGPEYIIYKQSVLEYAQAGDNKDTRW